MIRAALSYIPQGLPLNVFLLSVAIWDFPVGPFILWRLARGH